METDNIFLVLCGTFLLVLAINARAIVMLLRPGSTDQHRSWGNVIQAAKNPWREEEQELNELRKRVDELQRETDDPKRNSR